MTYVVKLSCKILDKVVLKKQGLANLHSGVHDENDLDEGKVRPWGDANFQGFYTNKLCYNAIWSEIARSQWLERAPVDPYYLLKPVLALWSMIHKLKAIAISTTVDRALIVIVSG